MWRLFFTVVVLAPLIFTQHVPNRIKDEQQQDIVFKVPRPSDCKCACVEQCIREYENLQRQLDAATAELAPLAIERNALGSEFARLRREISILEFQIKNPGKPVTSPRPIAHMRPPAIPVILPPLIEHFCVAALTECGRVISEGQSRLRTERQSIQSLLAQIPEARRQNAQMQARVNELQSQLTQINA